MMVVGQTVLRVLLSTRSLGRRLVSRLNRVRGRVCGRVLLLRLRRGRLMVLMNDARGSRMLQVLGRRRTLRVVGVMLHRGDTH
jgi:hypothetical protein